MWRKFLVGAAIVLNVLMAVLMALATFVGMSADTSPKEHQAYFVWGTTFGVIFLTHAWALGTRNVWLAAVAGVGIGILVVAAFYEFAENLLGGSQISLPLEFWIAVSIALLNMASLAALHDKRGGEPKTVPAQKA